jgi:hypothetical protein
LWPWHHRVAHVPHAIAGVCAAAGTGATRQEGGDHGGVSTDVLVRRRSPPSLHSFLPARGGIRVRHVAPHPQVVSHERLVPGADHWVQAHQAVLRQWGWRGGEDVCAGDGGRGGRAPHPGVADLHRCGSGVIVAGERGCNGAMIVHPPHRMPTNCHPTPPPLLLHFRLVSGGALCHGGSRRCDLDAAGDERSGAGG